MREDHGPCASLNVVVGTIPEFVVTTPRLQALASRQQGVAEAEGAVSWTDQSITIGDRATVERNLGLKVFVAMSWPIGSRQEPRQSTDNDSGSGTVVAPACWPNLVEGKPGYASYGGVWVGCSKSVRENRKEEGRGAREMSIGSYLTDSI